MEGDSDSPPTVVTELGTRIVMCERVGGSGVQVTHDRDGNPVLAAMDGSGARVEVVLSQREALGVVEALVVAAKPGAAERAVYTDPGDAARAIAASIAERTGRGAIEAKGKAVVRCPDCGEDVNEIFPGDAGSLGCDRCEEMARGLEGVE